MINLSPATFCFTILNIIIMFVFLKIFVFQKVMDVINEREKRIQKQFTDAQTAQEEAENLKVQYGEALSNAREEAESLVTKAKENAEKERAKILADTRVESEQLIEKAKENIKAEQKKAQIEAQAEIAKLAISAARKIIKTGEKSDAGSN